MCFVKRNRYIRLYIGNSSKRIKSKNRLSIICFSFNFIYLLYKHKPFGFVMCFIFPSASPSSMFLSCEKLKATTIKLRRKEPSKKGDCYRSEKFSSLTLSFYCLASSLGAYAGISGSTDMDAKRFVCQLLNGDKRRRPTTFDNISKQIKLWISYVCGYSY